MGARTSFSPRMMQEPTAAYYLGVSPSKLRGLPIRRKVDGGNRLYDKYDLDRYADGLPYEGDGGRNTCDEAFG